ncbi:MAG: isoprenylcysteine carboxylmethyltransferase family protein [Deltaproteobacteria bacterium]|nr:isoprenylcysteine carboxylmethyltransferase family protein [Deltaproteobacteria bacterium]
MTDTIFLIGLTVLFIITFTMRNLVVRMRTGRTVRSLDRFVALSVLSSTLCFIIAILSTNEPVYRSMGAISSLRHPFASCIGLTLLGISIILVWVISAQMKDSWRVGVCKDQETELIQDGLYAYVRNPYFLAYYVLFFGLFLVRPSLVLLLLAGITVFSFHRMILHEEAHLLAAHGERYKEYTARTGRYLPRFKKQAPSEGHSQPRKTH